MVYRLFRISFFLILLKSNVFCQSGAHESAIFNVEVGVAVMKSSLVEEKYSSLVYSGLQPAVLGRLNLTLKHAEHNLLFSYSGGTLSNDQAVSQLTRSQLNIDYYNLFPVYYSNNLLFSFKAGAGIEFLYNQRRYENFVNGGSSNETITSCAVTGEFAYRFGEAEYSLELKDRFILPVIFYYVQPAYSGTGGSDVGSTSQSNENHFVFIPEVVRFNNLISLKKRLNEQLSISLYYNWDFYNIRSSREMKQNNQELGISVGYTL